MEDADKIAYLRGMELMVGWTPGTDFEKATVKLEMNRGLEMLDYFLMSEIVEMVTYFRKLPTMIELGHQVTIADRFTYQILKTNGVFKAFHALDSEIRNDI